MTAFGLSVNLIIAIAIILVLVLKAKVNPTIALIVSSVTGGLKTYTLNTVTLMGMAFILCLIGATVFPLV